MKRILLVDDDPLVLRLYKRGLSQQRVQVDTAGDGLAAINTLRAGKPDLVVLDLMMPKFSGVDVLKFIRSQPELKSLPVVVLSNSYMNDLTEEAATLGVQKALLKVRCSPSILFGAINNILEGKTTDEDASLLAVPEQAPPVPESPARIGAKTPKTPPPAPTEAQTTTAEFQAQARRGFLRDAPATCIALRSLCRAFATAPNEAERNLRLQALCRKVHFIAATASLAECHRLAQMASVFEALLFELSNRPVSISASVLRTIASSVDFLAHLFDCARDADLDAPLSAQVLAVDDDPLTSRLVVAALLCAHLQVRSTADPLVGLQWLKETHFDLVLLDIQMPGIDGFELCRRLRLLPSHQKTPVIFVTSHSDFENRARSVLSGGDDLISKPVFPLELVVKAVAHLLKSQTAPRQPRLVRPDSSVRGHAS